MMMILNRIAIATGVGTLLFCASNTSTNNQVVVVEAFGGTFDQAVACEGQDGIVIRSDANGPPSPGGWYFYGASLIFCCDGLPYDVMCSEMMVAQCNCPVSDVVGDALFRSAPVCYGRKCSSKIYGEPGVDGVTTAEGVPGTEAICYVPGDNFIQQDDVDIAFNSQTSTFDRIRVSGRDFCDAYGTIRIPNPPVVSTEQRTMGEFEPIINDDFGNSTTGIIPVHAVMIPKTTKVLMWTRAQQPNVPPQPGTENTVSVVYDWSTGKYNATPLDSNPFCSGVGYNKDGNILAFGGEQSTAPWGEQWLPSLTVEGRNKIRVFDIETMTWATLNETIPSNHWYPTQTLLEDGRVLNQGGFVSMVGPQNEMLEIFDSLSNKITDVYDSTPFAYAMGIMNLYPFFSYIPYTNPERPDDIYLLMDLCNHAELYTINKDNKLTQLAVMDQMGGKGSDICAAFSAVGFSRFLPFRPPYNTVEYISFGGIVNSTQDIIDGKCWADVQGSDKSFRTSAHPIDIMLGASSWEEETMPFPRVGGLAVILPNGEFLILNGAEHGMGNDYLRTPVRTAVMYDPDAQAGRRYRTLATSQYNRLYHNIGMLLIDGTVLVAGGEQGEAYSSADGKPWCGSNYDYTFPAEIYKPPYVFEPEQRPDIVETFLNEEDYEFGSTIRVFYTGPDVTQASIVSPSAATHGTEQHSRTVFLEIAESSSSAADVSGTKFVDVVLPTMKHRVTSSGWHMLFLNNGKYPCKEGKWIKILDSRMVDANNRLRRRDSNSGLGGEK